VVSREVQAKSRRVDPYPERGSELWLLFCVDGHLGPAAGEPRRALAIHPRVLADPRVPQPHGQRLAALVTDHPDRRPADLVLLSDVAAELAETGESFQSQGLEWEGVVEAVARLYARGQVKALEFVGLSTEQVELLTGVPPAVDGAARALLRDRLRRRVLRARQRWYHPSRPGFGDGEPFL
jgi:hypothetical protein